ncbi:MAG: molybdate ABC transporter substrate-binding protein [Thermodesulfobacteriota bacterium]|jgi:molybdate transport system substrate-binding protein
MINILGRGNKRTARNSLITLLLAVSVIHSAQSLFAEPAKEITVSAAISLKDAFVEIGKIFKERHPGVKLVFNFAASGDLARQIEAGAPVDLFASAAQNDMDDIDRKGLLVANSRANFASNKMVLVKPARSRIPVNSFQDLQKNEIKRVVIGNPKTVPAGRYAEGILRYFSLWDVVKEKLVFAEHVRQVLDYVDRNEVDAAILYSTDAFLRDKQVKTVAVAPDGSHQPIIYSIATVKGTKNENLAKSFISLILSEEGKKVLQKFGFGILK